MFGFPNFTDGLTLCRFHLNTTAWTERLCFFQRAFNLNTKTSALECLGRHGTFKSRALWSVRDGKGLKDILGLNSQEQVIW
jgi:hypothetical protein